jgi:hypothetical protein
MDHKTKPFEVYTTTPTNISNEDNEGFDDTTNGQEQWGEDGASTWLMNITTTPQEFETPKVEEHESSNVRYYVEEP